MPFLGVKKWNKYFFNVRLSADQSKDLRSKAVLKSTWSTCKSFASFIKPLKKYQAAFVSHVNKFMVLDAITLKIKSFKKFKSVYDWI